MATETDMQDVTGETIFEAQFDGKLTPYVGWLISGYLLITVVGALLIPFWLAISRWYGAEYLRRMSARVTTSAVEIRKGVFFRKEVTIPLNRITDVRLHDGPLMRHYGLRGLRVETAGQSGPQATSEGDLIGVVDALEMRNAILVQRQRVLGEDRSSEGAAPAAPVADSARVLTDIRDILARIEERLSSRDG